MSEHVGEQHGALTIIAKSAKKMPNGYLYYYWVRCACGNVKRMRYDLARKGQPCGMCEDYTASGVLDKLKGTK